MITVSLAALHRTVPELCGVGRVLNVAMDHGEAKRLLGLRGLVITPIASAEIDPSPFKVITQAALLCRLIHIPVT